MALRRVFSFDTLKRIGESLTGEDAEQTHDPELMRGQLNTTLTNYSLIPKNLELFCWFYIFNIFTAACQTMARIPIDIAISCINSLRLLFGSQRMHHTSLYALILIVGWYIITRDFKIFDLSYLYHSFRGQSSVKLYGAGLALEISQKLLTMAGVSLLQKLHTINRHKDSSFQSQPLSFIVEMIIGLLYALVHFFSLYLDYTLYTIVLNSEGKNMLMYFFVVNLGKMKAATFKKFQQKNFRKSVLYDGKDRFLKITHSLMFVITAWERIDRGTICQVILVLFYCSVIDHLRHFSSLAMAGRHSEVEIIYKDAIESFQKRSSKIQRCMQWDFTVIPYCLLLLKFFSIAIWSHKEEQNFNWLVTKTYLFMLVYSCVIAPIIHIVLYKNIRKEGKVNDVNI